MSLQIRLLTVVSAGRSASVDRAGRGRPTGWRRRQSRPTGLQRKATRRRQRNARAKHRKTSATNSTVTSAPSAVGDASVGGVQGVVDLPPVPARRSSGTRISAARAAETSAAGSPATSRDTVVAGSPASIVVHASRTAGADDQTNVAPVTVASAPTARSGSHQRIFSVSSSRPAGAAPGGGVAAAEAVASPVAARRSEPSAAARARRPTSDPDQADSIAAVADGISRAATSRAVVRRPVDLEAADQVVADQVVGVDGAAAVAAASATVTRVARAVRVARAAPKNSVGVYFAYDQRLVRMGMWKP